MRARAVVIGLLCHLVVRDARVHRLDWMCSIWLTTLRPHDEDDYDDDMMMMLVTAMLMMMMPIAMDLTARTICPGVPHLHFLCLRELRPP